MAGALRAVLVSSSTVRSFDVVHANVEPPNFRESFFNVVDLFSPTGQVNTLLHPPSQAILPPG